MSPDLLRATNATAFNLGLVSYQVKHHAKVPAALAFLRGEKSAYTRLVRAIRHRASKAERDLIAAQVREGVLTAAESFSPQRNGPAQG